MNLKFLMDVHVPQAITNGLRRRGVDVVTAREVSLHEVDDSMLLDQATSLGRVLISQDADLLREARKRMLAGVEFSGVAYGHQNDLLIGQAVADLELMAKVYEPDDILNRVEHLPL